MSFGIILMFDETLFEKWGFRCEIICFGSGILAGLFVHDVFNVDISENSAVKRGDDLLSFGWLGSWWCIGAMNVASHFQRVMNRQALSHGHRGFSDVGMTSILVWHLIPR